MMAGRFGVMNYNDYYANKLDEGETYQDFVAEQLLQRCGWVFMGYASKKYQYEIGENKAGIEIKCQKNYKKYGNLCIETYEKAHSDNVVYARSGIYRGDNSILFITGDYDNIYIFSHTMLRLLEGKCKPYENKYKTSKGYLLPIDMADKYCIKRIDITT